METNDGTKLTFGESQKSTLRASLEEISKLHSLVLSDMDSLYLGNHIAYFLNVCTRDMNSINRFQCDMVVCVRFYGVTLA